MSRSDRLWFIVLVFVIVVLMALPCAISTLYISDSEVGFVLKVPSRGDMHKCYGIKVNWDQEKTKPYGVLFTVYYGGCRTTTYFKYLHLLSLKCPIKGG